MFIRVESFCPDKYGRWEAHSNCTGLDSQDHCECLTIIGSGPTEDEAILDCRESVSLHFNIPVDDVVIEGGIIRR